MANLQKLGKIPDMEKSIKQYRYYIRVYSDWKFNYIEISKRLIHIYIGNYVKYM